MSNLIPSFRRRRASLPVERNPEPLLDTHERAELEPPSHQRARSYSVDEGDLPPLEESIDEDVPPSLDELSKDDKVKLHSRSLSCKGMIDVEIDDDDLPELDMLEDVGSHWQINADRYRPNEEYVHLFQHRPFGIKFGAYASKAATLCVTMLAGPIYLCCQAMHC